MLPVVSEQKELQLTYSRPNIRVIQSEIKGVKEDIQGPTLSEVSVKLIAEIIKRIIKSFDLSKTVR